MCLSFVAHQSIKVVYLITLHFYSQTKRLTCIYLISKQVLFVGTSFSFAVFLKSSYLMGLIGFEPLLRPPRPACYLLTPSLPKLLSSRTRKLYRLSLRRSVHDDIQEMDFYSLFSYILYNKINRNSNDLRIFYRNFFLSKQHRLQ